MADLIYGIKNNANCIITSNTLYQVGKNLQFSRLLFVPVGNTSNWSSISLGLVHSAAITSAGTLWTWGANSFGQLGLSVYFFLL